MDEMERRTQQARRC